jgi:nucleotide-binding universal stress UspA family protein
VPPVVVGVGADEVSAALAYAAEEATRAGCGIHLVHAAQTIPAGAEEAVASMNVEELGREMLELARKQLATLVADEVPISQELRHGEPVRALVRSATHARMVVLEHHHLSRLARIVNRTVAGGVAAHTRVPVVAVPSGWTREHAEQVVVAAVDVPERAGEVLKAATAEARARGASLRVVHAWALPDPYETLYVDKAQARHWAESARADIRAALDRLGDLSVAVDADVRVHRGRAAEWILAESEAAELLVVGRHDPLVPVGSHIGPVARAVLREATCPVLLAAPSARHH